MIRTWPMGVILFIILFAAMPCDDQSFSQIVQELKERNPHPNDIGEKND